MLAWNIDSITIYIFPFYLIQIGCTYSNILVGIIYLKRPYQLVIHCMSKPYHIINAMSIMYWVLALMHFCSITRTMLLCGSIQIWVACGTWGMQIEVVKTNCPILFLYISFYYWQLWEIIKTFVTFFWEDVDSNWIMLHITGFWSIWLKLPKISKLKTKLIKFDTQVRSYCVQIRFKIAHDFCIISNFSLI